MHSSSECDGAGRWRRSAEHVHSPVQAPLREPVCVRSQELWVVWQTPSAIYLAGCLGVFDGKVQKLSQCPPVHQGFTRVTGAGSDKALHHLHRRLQSTAASDQAGNN